MDFLSLLQQTRSVRRFDHSQKLSDEILSSILESVRFVPSARNAQTLKYKIVNRQEQCDDLFPLLAWAGYLNDWKGPKKEEQPVAYIIVCQDNTLSPTSVVDEGIVLQTLQLMAKSKGVSSCILGAFDRQKVKEMFLLDSSIEVRYILALGFGVETVVVEDMLENQSIKYWRDEQEIHHVPKRKLKDLLL